MEWSPLFARNMEFWAVEVKTNEPQKIHPPKDKVIHLKQAVLGDLGNKSARLFVNVGGKTIVLGTLIPKGLPQQPFDLVFGKEFELSHNWDGSVFFSGSMADSPSNEYPLIQKFEPEAKPEILAEDHEAVAYPEGDPEPESSKKRPFESAAHGKDKKAKQETDGKQAVEFPCMSCRRVFKTEKALVSHWLAKYPS
ncbi:hypothetical protein OROHE_013310 [Orobanche hederae]